MLNERIEPHYCPLCECVCVVCAQLQSCDDCDLKQEFDLKQ